MSGAVEDGHLRGQEAKGSLGSTKAQRSLRGGVMSVEDVRGGM